MVVLGNTECGYKEKMGKIRALWEYLAYAYFFFYVFIDPASWICIYSINGELINAVKTETVSELFNNFILLETHIFGSIPSALFFFVITFCKFAVIWFGIRRGIEAAGKIVMPLLWF